MSKKSKSGAKASSIKRKVVAGAVALALLAAGAAGGHAVTISKFDPETAKDNASRIAAMMFVRGCIAASQSLAANPMAFMEAVSNCQSAGPQVYAAIKKQIQNKHLYDKPKQAPQQEEEKQGE
jgi:hypothetical protein